MTTQRPRAGFAPRCAAVSDTGQTRHESERGTGSEAPQRVKHRHRTIVPFDLGFLRVGKERRLQEMRIDESGDAGDHPGLCG